jgi:hypothetical protein
MEFQYNYHVYQIFSIHFFFFAIISMIKISHIWPPDGIQRLLYNLSAELYKYEAMLGSAMECYEPA